MAHQPIAGMSGVSILGGIIAFARTSSVPSLVASFTIGGAMALSSMRIKDNMSYGLEGAAASSLALFIPMLRRTVKTRAPIPAIIAALAAGHVAYYTNESISHRKTDLNRH